MTITPVLRYRNASAAARWLCEAFGFHEHDSAQELDDQVRYVSLRLGDSFVLVRPVANSVFDDLMVQPEAIGGANTQICYLTIPNTIDHCARAKAAGARIELEPQDDGLGGRFYTCRDLEGHLWSFGTRTYGVAYDVPGAFEPAELSASHPSTTISAPQGRGSRESSKRGLLLRSIAIAAAASIMVVGGWVFYDSYVGSPHRTMAAASTATGARVEEALEQLTDERKRRLAAEDASKDAATRLIEERSAAADLRQTLQRASAELSQLRQAKDEAVQRAGIEVAAARELAAEEKIKQAALVKQAGEETTVMREQLAKQQQGNLVDREQLQAAKTALLAAQNEIEYLRAGQFEPMVPDSTEPRAATGSVDTPSVQVVLPLPTDSACALAVQGKIPSGHKGPNTWAPANLARLCMGAEASVEPAKCFEEIMRGKIDWGAGSTWVTSNALALCGGARNARRTLDCFTKQIASKQTWQIAIRQCKTS